MFGLRQSFQRQAYIRAARTLTTKAHPNKRKFSSSTSAQTPQQQQPPTPPSNNAAAQNPTIQLTAEEEDKMLFEIFKQEMKGKHPTEALDRSRFQAFTPEELAEINATPKYSRHFTDMRGKKHKPRVVWLFPIYWCGALVGDAVLSSHFGPNWYKEPYNIACEKAQIGKEHFQLLRERLGV